VNGVYPASDGTDNGVVHDKYYWITFTGYDTSESVYAERIKVKKVEDEPERRLQPGPEPEPEPEPETRQQTRRKTSSLGRLFAAVDDDGDGDLDRTEVAALLRREGLNASDAHVDGIFDRCVSAAGVWWALAAGGWVYAGGHRRNGWQRMHGALLAGTIMTVLGFSTGWSSMPSCTSCGATLTTATRANLRRAALTTCPACAPGAR
jgi:hypothetical protein